MEINEPKTLRLILGDQLNINHSWFKKVDASVTYVLMEVRSETDYARHHIQKVIGFFAAMQSFAKELEHRKHHVIYIHLNDKNNFQQFDKNCEAIISTNMFTNFEYQLPDEFRLNEHLENFVANLKIDYVVCDTEHFYSNRNELKEFFKGKKTYLMESFYRYMRKKHRVLLEGEDKPINDKWNFDKDNRQKLPKEHKPIAPFLFANDIFEIEQEIIKANIKTIGTVDSKNFIWPISRAQAMVLLDFFIENCLLFLELFRMPWRLMNGLYIILVYPFQ